jgi:hypothetical protein
VLGLAVVVGLLPPPPPGEFVSGTLDVTADEPYRYQAGIASSIGSELCRCIPKRRRKSRSNLAHHIVRMLDFELQQC